MNTLPSPQLPQLGPIRDEPEGRDRFAGPELAIVLSHFDLGPLQSIQEFLRGSRRSPKVRIVGGRGRYLLKRRAPGRDEPERVAFAHDLQKRLAAHHYPVPGLIPDRHSGNTMLRWNGRVYEMFNFIRGKRDSHSPGAVGRAGEALGYFHRLLADHRPAYAPADGNYHDAEGMDRAWRRIPDVIHEHDPDQRVDVVEAICGRIRDAYREAVVHVDARGLRHWPAQVIHGDWHPGNLLTHDGAVVGVLDFDSARLAPRIVDVANAALQYAMIMPTADTPERWPDALDVSRIQALLAGYDHAVGHRLTADEVRVLPWLMLEALILESVVPIAATGRFGGIRGAAFLEMVDRKQQWLRPRIDPLIRSLLG